MLCRCVFPILLVSLLCFPAAADEQHQHGPVTGKLGDVTFETSCDKSVAKDFRRAVAMLHSFWYSGAETAFGEIAKKDPECAMAYWGIAMSAYHPLWAVPTTPELQRGRAALAKARNAKRQTAREREWIEAIARPLELDGKIPLIERNKAWAAGMEKVHSANPADTEAEIYYLLARLSTASPSDKSYAVQKAIGPRLEQLFAKYPTHPGLPHYVIHTYDYPELAPRALDAARRYASIAPESAHALHMPSHIFTRLGLWQDSIRSNIDSANAARRDFRSSQSPYALGEQLHAMDYLTYGYIQRGEVDAARRILAEMKALGPIDRPVFAGVYASAAIPARYFIETHQWKDARDLPEPGFTGESYWTEVANAIVFWTRSLGAARTGQLDRARADVEKMRALREKLVQSKRQDGADTIEVLRLSASAWIAFAAGQPAEAERLMRASADLEDRTEKHPVTPGAVLPAREQLADLLAQTGRPAEALREYRASLATAPNRLNGLLGAARAAERAGNKEAAAEYYAKVLQVAPKADPKLLKDAKQNISAAR